MQNLKNLVPTVLLFNVFLKLGQKWPYLIARVKIEKAFKRFFSKVFYFKIFSLLLYFKHFKTCEQVTLPRQKDKAFSILKGLG